MQLPLVGERFRPAGRLLKGLPSFAARGRRSACRLGALAALSAVLCGLGCGRRQEAPAAAAALQVYVPCGMELPFMDLERAFVAANPGVSVRIVMDSAHFLARRVTEQRECPDVVISPGGIELAPLLEAGLVDQADVRHFGRFDLCLFVPRANRAGVATIADLAADRVRTVAVADPEKTSIGHFTVETLRRSGVWDQVEPKVVFTGDASQTYKHIAADKADASFAYRSCPLRTAPDKIAYSKVRVIQSVPETLYGPAYASAAILKAAPNRQLARAFVDLLLSDAGQAVLESYELPGVRPPPSVP